MVDFGLIKKLEQDQHIAVILAGGFGGIAVARELGRHKIPTIVLGQQIYVTMSKYCFGIYMGDTGEIIEFLTRLPKYVSKKPVLFTDNECCLELLYKNWSLLKEHYLAPLDPNNLRLNNKFLLVQFAKACGLKVPEVYEGVNAVAGYPVIVKPLNGLAHRNPLIKKAYQCHNQRELSQALQLLNQHNAEALIQQIIPGDTQDLYSVILYRSSPGNILIGSVTRKIREYPSRYGTGTAHITCTQPDIVNCSIHLLNTVGYNGVAEIEYKYNKETKDFYIIEVNGRFPLQTSIVHKIGNQFIYRIYLDLIASPVKDTPSVAPNQKAVIWSFFLKDVLAAKSKRSLIAEYYSYVCHSQIQGAIWDWSDIKPLLYYYKYLLHRSRQPLGKEE